MKGIRDAATTIEDVATSIRTVVDQNKDPLSDFARSGLYDFSLFLAEARILGRWIEQTTQSNGQGCGQCD